MDNEEPLFYNDVDTQKTEEKPVDDVPKPANLPKKYKGYEELLNIDENVIDDIKLPTGIHSNVRALQYTLEHPLVFTEHSGKHYRRRKTKRNKQRVNILLFVVFHCLYIRDLCDEKKLILPRVCTERFKCFYVNTCLFDSLMLSISVFVSLCDHSHISSNCVNVYALTMRESPSRTL